MKKMILTLIAAITVSTALAFQHGPRQATPAERTDRMAQELKLSKKQKEKLLALNEKYADAFATQGKRGPRPPRDGKPEGRKPEGKPGAQQGGCHKSDRAQGGCCKDSSATQQKDCCQGHADGKQGVAHKRPELTAEQKAKMEAMRQKRAEYDKELQGILSKKQYQAYQENQKKHRGHHAHAHRHGKDHRA